MTTKRGAGDIRFLATKAVVGGLAVATFIGAWGGIAVLSTVSGNAEDAVAEEAAPSVEAAAEGTPAGPGQVIVIERQVVYYVIGGAAAEALPAGPASSLPPASRPAPAASVAPAPPAAAPPAKAAPKAAKKSKGS